MPENQGILRKKSIKRIVFTMKYRRRLNKASKKPWSSDKGPHIWKLIVI